MPVIGTENDDNTYVLIIGGLHCTVLTLKIAADEPIA